MRLVDDDGNDAPEGEVGEIVISGHNVMKGYSASPEATAEVMRDGWFRTGDLARRDEDGYYFIVDRKKDLIIRGGYNVYPREIEEVLYEHPAVAEAAVVGVPHDECGEEIGAAVTLKPGASRHRGRAARLRQGARRGLQVPADRLDHLRAPEGPDRQDPQARDPHPGAAHRLTQWSPIQAMWTRIDDLTDLRVVSRSRSLTTAGGSVVATRARNS